MDKVIGCIALFSLGIVQIHCAPRGRCVVEGDMRVPEGYTWTSNHCGQCECKPGGIISCPDNPSCQDQSEVLECQYEGRVLQIGDKVDQADGCNTCTCMYGGLLNCTTKPCFCMYQGTVLPIGNTVRANDSCNTCTCTWDGKLSCTAHLCAPEVCVFRNVTYGRGQEFSRGDGCNNCTCGAERRITCTETRCIATKCIHEGVTYQAGQEFPKGDGCNNCMCEFNGEISCSMTVCPPTEPSDPWSTPSLPPSSVSNRTNDKTCKQGERSYTEGEQFSSHIGADGIMCRTCTCVADQLIGQGTVSSHWVCTERRCSTENDREDTDDGSGQQRDGSSVLDQGWRPVTLASLITWISNWFKWNEGN